MHAHKLPKRLGDGGRLGARVGFPGEDAGPGGHGGDVARGGGDDVGEAEDYFLQHSKQLDQKEKPPF